MFANSVKGKQRRIFALIAARAKPAANISSSPDDARGPTIRFAFFDLQLELSKQLQSSRRFHLAKMLFEAETNDVEVIGRKWLEIAF